MVHKKFVNTSSRKENNWIDRTPYRGARNYLDEMAPINGFQEENAESLRLRDAFRDEVSKRMGELLLKGQTMLDEYCPTCSGILMEDRAGVRRCVTCELYAEKLAQAGTIVAEVPLQGDELSEAVDNIPRPGPTEKKVSQKAAVVVKTASSKKIVKVSESGSSSNTLTAAKEAVLQKLEWATAELSATVETARVLDFLAVIQKSAETLQSLQI